MIFMTVINKVEHRKREQCRTNHMLQSGPSLVPRPPSPCVLLRLLAEDLWQFSQLSLGSLFQLLQIHTVPNLNPTSLTTACVLTSLSRRPRTGSSDQRIRTHAETSQSRQVTHGHSNVSLRRMKFPGLPACTVPVSFTGTPKFLVLNTKYLSSAMKTS